MLTYTHTYITYLPIYHTNINIQSLCPYTYSHVCTLYTLLTHGVTKTYIHTCHTSMHMCIYKAFTAYAHMYTQLHRHSFLNPLSLSHTHTDIHLYTSSPNTHMHMHTTIHLSTHKNVHIQVFTHIFTSNVLILPPPYNHPKHKYIIPHPNSQTHNAYILS